MVDTGTLEDTRTGDVLAFSVGGIAVFVPTRPAVGDAYRSRSVGLDNLHEYLKFSYPRMQAPSFICENESRQGLTLHYRSKRRGFVYYTMGQIKEVARHFYHKVRSARRAPDVRHCIVTSAVWSQEMRIELVREEILMDTVHVTFQLKFDNRAFTLASMTMTREEKHLPISASVLFEIFPFCIVFRLMTKDRRKTCTIPLRFFFFTPRIISVSFQTAFPFTIHASLATSIANRSAPRNYARRARITQPLTVFTERIEPIMFPHTVPTWSFRALETR